MGMSLEEMEAATLKVLNANLPLLQADDDFILGQMVSPKNDESGEANFAIYCQFIDFVSFAHSYSKGVRLVSLRIRTRSRSAYAPLRTTGRCRKRTRSWRTRTGT